MNSETYDNWTPDQLKAEIEKQKVRRRKVRRARIDEIWPSYYNALMAMALNSTDAMRNMLVCSSIKKVYQIARAEIASLQEFIDEIEKQNELQDTVINLIGTPRIPKVTAEQRK